MNDLPIDQVIEADCLEIMQQLPSNSIDSIVCDPPSGISFMNEKWDSNKGGRKQWCAFMEERFTEALRVCKPGAHAFVWALPRTSHWTATALEDAGWEIRDIVTHCFGSGMPKSLDIGKKSRNPKWHGWGSGLKPSSEHWILCRKPIEDSIAKNVLSYGVGGINIDSCRVEYATEYDKKHQEDIAKEQENATNGRIFGSKTIQSKASTLVMKGRWPSNLVFSHAPECNEERCLEQCAVQQLDRQGGIRKSGGALKNKAGDSKCGNVYGAFVTKKDNYFPLGGEKASRYFPVFHYFPKASQRDRTCNKAVENTHPTVKNRELMKWLVRLITPKNGIVLDMFAGSGSTALACLEEGFNYLLIECETKYVEIANDRIAAWHKENKPLLSVEDRLQWLETKVDAIDKRTRKQKKDDGQMSLFDDEGAA